MGRRPASLWATAAAAAALALVCPQAQAQIYDFNELPVVPKHSLRPLYAFYVYSQEDAPNLSPEQPYVEWQVVGSGGARSDSRSLESYASLQLTLVPFAHFMELIHPTRFCADSLDVQQGAAEKPNTLLVHRPAHTTLADAHVLTQTIPMAHMRKDWRADSKASAVRTPIQATAAYILIFSNCGNFSDATISGSVTVRNPYGFAPGYEFWKIRFFFWLGVVYFCMGLVWIGLSIKWRGTLFRIQHCIGGVILMGFVEAATWWSFYVAWNGSGIRNDLLFGAGIATTVVKAAFSYMLVLVAALGWGVTRPHLDRSTNLKVATLTFFYIALDMIRELVLSFRHSHTLGLPFVLGCLLPSSILNASIFFWIFSALSGLIRTLEERKQTAKLQLFRRLWQVIVSALSVATFTLMFQIVDLSQSISIRWHYQWFVDIGISHMLFLLVLMAMMYLWAPHADGQRYAFSEQIGMDDVDDAETGASNKVPRKADHDDDAGFWDEPLALEDGPAPAGPMGSKGSGGGSGPAPEIIGSTISTAIVSQ